MGNHHLCKSLSAAALMLGTQGAFAAPVLQYSNGGADLLGATGVSVNGQLYNVQFETGSCTTVFSPCGNNAPVTFTFGTSADATAASNAVLNQIGGAVFQSPTKIGPSSYSGFLFYIDTPYTVSGNLVDVQAFDFYSETVGAGQLGAGQSSLSTNAAYAVWTADSAPVPEPASAAILAAGVAALGLARRRTG